MPRACAVPMDPQSPPHSARHPTRGALSGKAALFGGRSRLCSVALFACAGASAQTAAVDAPSGTPPRDALEPVVITVWRKPENQIVLPQAVSTLDAQDMTDLKVTGYDGVGQTIPNVTVQRRFGTGSGPLISMRGLDMGSFAFETDMRIALYLDDVFMGRYGGMSAFLLADLCGMTALRGPQGTLFGRNAEAGAIRLETCAPAAEPQATLSMESGNYRERENRLSLDSGRHGGFSARLALMSHEHDGYVNNLRPGVVTELGPPFGTIVSASKLGQDSANALALDARYESDQGLKLNYRYDSTNRRDSQNAVQLLALYGGAKGLYDPANGAGGIAPSLTRLEAVPEEFAGTDRLRISGQSLSAELPLGPGLQLKYILSLRRMWELGGGNDIDGTSFNGKLLTLAGIPTPASTEVCYICSTAFRTQQQVAHELRLTAQVSAWDLAGGLFAMRESAHSDSPVFIGGRFIPGLINPLGALSALVPSDYFTGTLGDVLNRSLAIFGHANYALTPALALSAGLRLTLDERGVHQLRGASGALDASRRFDYADWEAAALYSLDDRSSVYARLATGHMAGGVQSGIPFDPEFTRSLDIGFKSVLLDQRLHLNVAAFGAQVARQQLPLFSPTIGSYVLNAGNSQQTGIEVEMQARAGTDLDLHASYGYIRVHSSLGFAALTPPQTFSVGGEYRFARLRASGVLPTIRVDASWHDRAAIGPCQIGQSAKATGCVGTGDAALTQAVSLPPRTQLDLRLRFSDIRVGAQAAAGLSFWVRNALDSRKLQFARDMGNGTVMGSFEDPRTLGVTLDATF